MNNKEMSVEQYKRTEELLLNLRTIVGIFLAVSIATMVLVNVVSMGYAMDNEFCSLLLRFMADHDTILMLLGIVTAVSSVLYYACLMQIPFPERDLIVAGVIGLAGTLYQGTSIDTNIADSDTISALTDAVTSGVITIAFDLIFRKLYCDAMCKITEQVDEESNRSWKKLWSLTYVVSAISIIILVVLKYVGQGMVKNLDHWSSDYQSVYNRFVIVSVVVASATMIVEIILYSMEMKCLKRTHDSIYSKRIRMNSPESTASQEGSLPN